MTEPMQPPRVLLFLGSRAVLASSSHLSSLPSTILLGPLGSHIPFRSRHPFFPGPSKQIPNYYAESLNCSLSFSFSPKQCPQGSLLLYQPYLSRCLAKQTVSLTLHILLTSLSVSCCSHCKQFKKLYFPHSIWHHEKKWTQGTPRNLKVITGKFCLFAECSG